MVQYNPSFKQSMKNLKRSLLAPLAFAVKAVFGNNSATAKTTSVKMTTKTTTSKATTNKTTASKTSMKTNVVSVSRGRNMKAKTSTAAATTTTTTPSKNSGTLQSSDTSTKAWSSFDVSVVYKDASSGGDEKYVSSFYQNNDVFDKFDMPGYTAAKMRVNTTENGTPITRSFEFLIGPSQMNESFTNTVNSVKTGSGFFVLRAGMELSRVTIVGYLLESSTVDERRLFLEEYYKKYMIDKVNAFHEYFNESTLFLELMGYQYQCILLNLELSRSSQTMFTFSYNMNLLILHKELLSNVIKPALQDGQVITNNSKFEVLNLSPNLRDVLVSTVSSSSN